MVRCAGMDKNDNVGPLSGLPPTELTQGPQRRAPHFYVGTHVGRIPLVYPDTEVFENGAVPGVRNKAARRVIRAAQKRKHSQVEKGLKLVRDMKLQAVEVVTDTKKDKSPEARRHLANALLREELSLHRPVYVPSQKELRRMRTEKRKAMRAGGKLPIDMALDALLEKRP